MPVKKIYDIIPPRQKSRGISQQVEIAVRRVKPKETQRQPSARQTQAQREIAENKRPKIGRKFAFPKKSFLIVAAILALVAAGFYLTAVFAKVTVRIWPETQVLKSKDQINIDTSVKAVDIQKKVIPGKVLEVSKVSSQQFPATGKAVKEQKAQGAIRVYNSYSTSSQVLIATTRFISSDGKLFRSLEKVVIPGGVNKNGKLEPGYLDVKVIAAEAGPEYNIGPATFSIPGLAGTPKYTAFYGKSSSAMSGGYRGEGSKVMALDLEKAKDSLIERMTNEARKILQESAAKEDFVLIERGEMRNVEEKKALAKAGDITDTFGYEAKIRYQAIAFKKSDLEGMVKGIIFGQMPQNKKLKEGSLETNWNADFADIVSGKATLSVNYLVKIAADINMPSFEKSLRGKTLNEAKMFLNNFSEISKAKIDVQPFWLTKIPMAEGKLKIETQSD